MKKSIALLLALALCFALVACAGNEAKPTATPTTAPTAAPTEKPTEPSVAPTEEPTEPALEYVEVTQAQELLDAFASPFSGAYKLMNDITIPAESKVKIMPSITIDLNGFVLTVEQDTADSNAISIQGNYEPTTLTIEDNSEAGTGVLRGLITKNGAGRTFIRCNLVGGIPNFFVLKSGTIEYVTAEGVTSVFEKIVLFHITQADSGVSIEGGKVVCTLAGANLKNPGDGKHSKAPVINGGLISIDPTEYLGEGKTATQETVDGQTFWKVG